MMILILRACAISMTMDSLGSALGARARDTLLGCLPIMAARSACLIPARSMCSMICSIGLMYKHAIYPQTRQAMFVFLCALKVV